MFTLPIPRLSEKVALHRDLAAAGRAAEAEAAAVGLDEALPFTRARRLVRKALRASGTAACIDALVARLFDEPA